MKPHCIQRLVGMSVSVSGTPKVPISSAPGKKKGRAEKEAVENIPLRFVG
jgi:hypothetical protein